MYRATLLFIALLLFPANVAAANRHDVHVLTIGPGSHLFTRFGHVALVTEDHKTGIKKVYNFGEFDFGDPALRTKYIRGDLAFWLEISSYETFVKNVKQSSRDATLRTLYLTEEQSEELTLKLRAASAPENRYYQYNHYTNNCCTKVRDLIDDVMNGLLLEAGQKEDRTYRYWTGVYLDGAPILKGLFMFVLGPAIDRPINRWEAQFLPQVFSEDLDEMRLSPNQKLLVKRKAIIHKGQAISASSTPPLMDYLTITAILALLLVCFSYPIARPGKISARRLLGIGLIVWGLLGGLGGLGLTFFYLATNHTDTYYNENLLLFSPTHLLLLVPGIVLLLRARMGAILTSILNSYLALFVLLAVVDIAAKLGPFIQQNTLFILLSLTCNVAGLVALLRIKTEVP
ncbi:MAG: DUF4105 domain-containing protein [Deltaproteobacteria bacterium]|nr:DUF4105 domain-containing protein [Deltaproteobacteria bacterium]